MAWERGPSSSRAHLRRCIQWGRIAKQQGGPHFSTSRYTRHWPKPTSNPATTAYCSLCPRRRRRRTQIWPQQHRNSKHNCQRRLHATRHTHRPGQTQPHKNRQHRTRQRPRHGHYVHRPPYPARRPHRPQPSLPHGRLAPLWPPPQKRLGPPPPVRDSPSSTNSKFRSLPPRCKHARTVPLLAQPTHRPALAGAQNRLGNRSQGRLRRLPS